MAWGADSKAVAIRGTQTAEQHNFFSNNPFDLKLGGDFTYEPDQKKMHQKFLWGTSPRACAQKFLEVEFFSPEFSPKFDQNFNILVSSG